MLKKLIIILALACAGCASLAPDYSRPAMPVSETWPAGEAYKHDIESELPALMEFVKDERLLQLVMQALSANRSLRSQIADVEAARAAYRIERAGQFPTVNLNASGEREGGDGINSADAFGLNVGLASFEIDLFGRVRSLKEAALQSYLSAVEASDSARIALVAETANAWVTLAADRERLAIARNTMESAGLSAEIAQGRYNSGVTSLQDVYQAQTVYQQTRADVANYTTLVAQDMNALELLIGGKLAEAFLPKDMDDIEGALGEVKAGLSSDLLLERPDIKAAEHMLLSANANIGTARAAFFPRISLTATAGFMSDALSSLFDSGVWSFGGSLAQTIFDGGRKRADLDRSWAIYESYLAQYEGSIQRAFRETADALARRGTIDEQLSAYRELTTIAQESFVLAEARYSAGVDSYLNVLTSQRTLYSSELALTSTRLTEFANRVTLYRVLGGGL